MATRSQPHGTRWLEFGGIQMIKAVCTVATVTKEIVLTSLTKIKSYDSKQWIQVKPEFRVLSIEFYMYRP